MADSFDPYHIWLGIPPEDQPPDHYRLLGVKQFESNPDVLESAADQRMAHVRSFQTGKRAAESQKLLNELSAARACLLSPDKRQAYDQTLRAKLAPAPRRQPRRRRRCYPKRPRRAPSNLWRWPGPFRFSLSCRQGRCWVSIRSRRPAPGARSKSGRPEFPRRSWPAPVPHWSL